MRGWVGVWVVAVVVVVGLKNLSVFKLFFKMPRVDVDVPQRLVVDGAMERTCR